MKVRGQCELPDTLVNTFKMQDNKPVIRPSVDGDIETITSIYANEVLHGLASFELKPPDTKEMAARRNSIVQAGFPYLAATLNNKVVGFAYAGPYRTRPAYRHTVENSVYVATEQRKHGIGSALLAELISLCEKGNWRTMIAIIGDTKNTSSIALHKSLGFSHVGTIQATGYKLNQWVDTVIMQRALNLNPDTNRS